jgi:hypothetical protein
MIRKTDIESAKVNRATPQSVFGNGFYPDKRDSKLYFEQRGIKSAAQNHLPLTGSDLLRSRQSYQKNAKQLTGLWPK